MAPVAVADKSSRPSLSQGEVEVILKRAGIEEKNPEAFHGRGGISMVVAVAVFSSLAGLLMGLDIGYIAGVKTMDSFSEGLLHQDELKDTQGPADVAITLPSLVASTVPLDSLITMIFGVGAALAAFPPVMDFCVRLLGRKGAVLCGGAVFCLGAALQALAVNMAMMLLGRIIAGFSVGLLSGNAPVYTSEIAPPKLRGALVTGFQFAITVGIMLAFLLALILENVEKPYGGWRWVIAAQIVPGALLVLGGLVMPGSPRYLVGQGKVHEALKMLLLLRSEDVREELAEICQEHEAESAAKATWGEFLSGDNLKLLGIGISIQLLQQLCGMNAFMYDGPLIFKRLFGTEHAGILFTLVSGVVNIFATIPGLFLVDRCGRTVLMKWSAIGMMLCSAVLASIGDMCFEDGTGHCGAWAKTASLAICGFILNFAYGWGGMAWVYCAEMFPQRHRTKGVAATTDANWVGNILIAFLPPLMFANWGFNTFWVFVGTNSLCLFCAMSLPETKDKSLEEVTLMFNDWFHPGACKVDGDTDVHSVHP